MVMRGESKMSSMVTRRGFVGGVTLVGLALVGCGNTQVGANENDTSAADATKAVYEMSREEEEEAIKKEPFYGKKLTVGYGGGLCLGAFGITEDQGYSADEGLDCELMNVQSKIDAVGSGQVQVVGTHIASLLVPAYNGIGMTFTLGIHSGCKSLYVLTDGSVQSTQDLRRQTIGIPEGMGSADQNIAMRFLGRDEVDPKSDVEWKQVAKEACIQGMQNGEIAAAVLEDQYAMPFVSDGTITYIRSLTYDDDFKVEPCCILAFNSDFAKENPVHVKRYTRAFQKAGVFIEQNTEQALDILLQNSWASGDRDDDLALMQAFDYTITEQRTKDSLLDIIADYQKYGIIDSEQSADEVLAKVWAPVLDDVQ